jgi:hypothetical protein
MTVIQIPFDAPKFIINTTDISGSMVEGVSYKGAMVYDIDAKKWYVVKDDLKLGELVWITAT